jgi:hypothetical protein
MTKKYIVKETFPLDYTFNKLKIKCNIPIGTLLEINQKKDEAVVKARHNEDIVFVVSDQFGEIIKLNDAAYKIIDKRISGKSLRLIINEQ